MKYQKLCAVCLVVLMICALPLPVLAVDQSRSFRFSLSAEGQQTVSVPEGQEFTVTLTLERTDQTEEWNMYAWQTEIAFDPDAFALVEDSVKPARGVGSSWHPGDRESRLYFNAYSLSKSGSPYPASLEAGSFRMKALKAGTFTVHNENYLVSTAGGEDRYRSEASDLGVTVEAAPASSGEHGTGQGTAGGPGQSSSGTEPEEEPGQEVPGTGSAEEPNSGETGNSGVFRFRDVPMDAWYVDAVTDTVQRGLFKGVSETSFDPQGSMTRAMLVAVLHRLEGTPAAIGISGFEDVPSGTWYADAVAWARESGVVEGYSDTLFGPEDLITREQMATILHRDSERKGQDVSKVVELSRYTDEHEVSDWARQAMSWANAEGLIIGRSENTLNPKDTATRAEVAMIMMRYCKWMEL